MGISDSEIIRAIRENRDQVAVKSIYDHVLPNVRKFILANSGSSEDAMDIFHDALLSFFKLVINNKFDADKYKIYGFVYTLCRNLWINQAKKRSLSLKWQENSGKDTFEESVLEQLVSAEKLSLVQKLMRDLGDKCLELLTLYMYNDLSYKEIAIKMGFESESSAKVKAHRCRKALSEKIKADRDILEQLKH